jgi:hypothetical protein
MTDEERSRVVKVQAESALGGMLWFAGWLFTIGFAKLTGWSILFGLAVWPYYLGLIVRGG